MSMKTIKKNKYLLILGVALALLFLGAQQLAVIDLYSVTLSAPDLVEHPNSNAYNKYYVISGPQVVTLQADATYDDMANVLDTYVTLQKGGSGNFADQQSLPFIEIDQVPRIVWGNILVAPGEQYRISATDTSGTIVSNTVGFISPTQPTPTPTSTANSILPLPSGFDYRILLVAGALGVGFVTVVSLRKRGKTN